MTESVREAICCVSMYGTTSSGALSQSCGCVWSMVRYGCVWRDTGASGNLRARLAPYGRVLAPYGRVLAPYGRCWRPTGVCRRPTGAKTNALTPVSATGCFFQVGGVTADRPPVWWGDAILCDILFQRTHMTQQLYTDEIVTDTYWSHYNAHSDDYQRGLIIAPRIDRRHVRTRDAHRPTARASTAHSACSALRAHVGRSPSRASVLRPVSCSVSVSALSPPGDGLSSRQGAPRSGSSDHAASSSRPRPPRSCCAGLKSRACAPACRCGSASFLAIRAA
jgi:hypothetical protein